MAMSSTTLVFREDDGLTARVRESSVVEGTGSVVLTFDKSNDDLTLITMTVEATAQLRDMLQKAADELSAILTPPPQVPEGFVKDILEEV